MLAHRRLIQPSVPIRIYFKLVNLTRIVEASIRSPGSENTLFRNLGVHLLGIEACLVDPLDYSDYITGLKYL
jgi:hypothetical protein